MPAKKAAKKPAKKKYTKRSPYWTKFEKGVHKVTIIPPEKEIKFPHERILKDKELGIAKLVPVPSIIVGADITLNECTDSLIRWLIKTKPSVKSLKGMLIAAIASKGMMLAEDASDFMYLKRTINTLGRDDEPSYLKKDRLIKAKLELEETD